MVFNYNIRFVQLNLTRYVRFLVGRFETVRFFRRLQNYKRGKKTALQIRQMAKQIGQKPRKPPINKGFGKFVKGRGKKWMIN